MTAIANAYANAILTYLKGGGAPTAIAALYLDIYGSDPTTGGGSVLSTITGSATRPNVTSSMGAPANRQMTNTTAINLTDSAVAGAYVGFVAFFDAATSGNLVLYDPLSDPQTVTLGNGCSFPIGSIQISLF